VTHRTSAGPDPFRRADKRASWNEYASAYWHLADRTSHPSPKDIETYLAGVATDHSVLVLGATTTGVIAAAVARGARVHVLDFAERLLEQVRLKIDGTVRLHHHDLLQPPGPELVGQFDVVVADRLINRFHRSEMGVVLSHMMSFVAPSGVLRTAVRFGKYPLDERLIARGQELGTVDRFWDARSRTIDWSRVGVELDDVASAHGDIPRHIVIEWSRRRGVESRLEYDDIPPLVDEAAAGGRPLLIKEVLDMELASHSKIYVFASGL
jgi:hypothetical protein